MMQKDIYDPLTAYKEVYRDRFREVVRKTFASIASEARVDVAANRATCRQIHAQEGELQEAGRRLRHWKIWRNLLWMAVGGAVVFFISEFDTMESWVPLPLSMAIVFAAAYLILRVRPQLQMLREDCEDVEAAVRDLKKEAWNQMLPLNRLYDWDILTRMMSETVPRLEFDPYFTTQRLDDLKRTYGWDPSFNDSRSVLYAHSGSINGNPFVICRTRKMVMGTKEYWGSKTISWTTRERGSDGKYCTVHHSETLNASVTAPCPEYFEKTRLFYGNNAAPGLCFHRTKSGLAGREDSLSFKWHRRSLRKKARNLEEADFAMMTNEDFEVAFDTRNRNDNQQYALLFTPLAQESMLNLLTDREEGYGDDFDFIKSHQINCIVADHMQKLKMDLNPEQYCYYEYDAAEQGFYALNAELFRAIYFCMAPLLCVPMYQQVRSHETIYGDKVIPESSYWEHEALANYWGQKQFMHPDCVTPCLLKTEVERSSDEGTSVMVFAKGYRKEERVTYVSKYGGDGRYHSVPVCWDEYFPVTGKGRIQLQEDAAVPGGEVSQAERMRHVRELLSAGGMAVYRRHIASRAQRC